MEKATWIVRLSDDFGAIVGTWIYIGTQIEVDAFGEQIAWGDLDYTVTQATDGPTNLRAAPLTNWSQRW